jgi:hypothetical protein
MAQEYKPGQIVPQSGVYKVTHDPVHADILHEVTVIRGLPRGVGALATLGIRPVTPANTAR